MSWLEHRVPPPLVGLVTALLMVWAAGGPEWHVPTGSNGLDKALCEAVRVPKPGGRFFCLEFSKVDVAPLRPLYDIYSFAVLPFLGRVVARDAESYQYLAESIRQFPPQDELAKRMIAAGFENVSWKNLSGGIAAIHSGYKPKSVKPSK